MIFDVYQGKPEYHEEAIVYYLQRVEKGCQEYSFDEVFYSLYRVGECYKKLEDYDQAEIYYLKAWEFDKERNEPLCASARGVGLLC